MKRKLLVSVSLLWIMFLFSSCPQPRGIPALEPVTAQRIYNLPFGSVWDATLAVVTEDLKWPLEAVERETGLISTQWVTYERKPGDYIDVEESSVNTPTKPILVSYRVIILVKITPEGTMVRVRRYAQEWLDKWTPVQSDLQFERQFLLMVDKRLGVSP